jgi:hypothetical protein
MDGGIGKALVAQALVKGLNGVSHGAGVQAAQGF